eukprot:1790415-Prymnesium_polylepis.1
MSRQAVRVAIRVVRSTHSPRAPTRIAQRAAAQRSAAEPPVGLKRAKGYGATARHEHSQNAAYSVSARAKRAHGIGRADVSCPILRQMKSMRGVAGWGERVLERGHAREQACCVRCASADRNKSYPTSGQRAPTFLQGSERG